MHVLMSDLREGEAFEAIPGEPLPRYWSPVGYTVVLGATYNYTVATGGGPLPVGWSWVGRAVLATYTSFWVNIVPRWDGWVDPVRFAQAQTGAAKPQPFTGVVPPSCSTAPVVGNVKIAGSFDDYLARVAAVHKFPHTCNLCGAPALEMFSSVECSKSCVPGRAPK